MIGLIGTSFKSAEISVREQFAFTPEDIIKLSGILQNNADHKGLVVLSTCNRTEIYFYSRKRDDEDGFNLILSALTTLKNYSDNQRDAFYFKSGKNVAEHLFKVTSGIDSLVIGEDQIIGQVRNAFCIAEEIKSIDTILSRLFTKAFEAGKKVRANTTINQGAASVSSAAVDLYLKRFPKLSERTVFVIGAGQTGQLVLTSLGKRQMKSLYVANRTVSKAQELAQKYGGTGVGLDEIEKYLPKSDIVIVATDSGSYLLTEAMMQRIKSNLEVDSQLLIDLSVPRNIDPKLDNFSHVSLYAVDDLTEIVNSTTQKRTEAIDDALKIIDQLSTEYMDWLTVRGLSPIFEKIKTNFSKLHQEEVSGYAKINGIEENEKLDAYGKHISDKYARSFIRNLRQMVKNGESKQSIEAIYELFDL